MNFCTPQAKISLSKLLKNISSYAQNMYTRKFALRPHIKTHKCCQIAKLQIKEGATGITASRLHEVEAMVNCGIKDIFLAYPVVGNAEIEIFNDLNQNCEIIVAIDSLFHLKTLQKVANKKHPAKIRIEINSGQNRCGVNPERDDLNKICEFIKSHKDEFVLNGVFTHPGHVYKCANYEQIKAVAQQEVRSVEKAAEVIKVSGLDCPVISIGSTPTAMITESELVSECRPGNYVFFDAIQVANGTCKLQDCALTIVTTVIGLYDDHLVIDAGSKALGLDKGAHGASLVKGYGIVKDYPDLEIESLSEEHGIVRFSNRNRLPAPGDILEVIPNHSCAAANMFSQYQVFKHNNFYTTWPIQGKR